jgi:hypothetical protein
MLAWLVYAGMVTNVFPAPMVAGSKVSVASKTAAFTAGGIASCGGPQSRLALAVNSQEYVPARVAMTGADWPEPFTVVPSGLVMVQV